MPVSSTLALMNSTQFRTLLALSIVFGIIGGAIDFLFPSLLAESFWEAQKAHDESRAQSQTIFFGVAGLATLVLFFAAAYGLYAFRPWAPRLAALATGAALALAVGAGALAQSGWAIALSHLASYLWGAVLLLAFFSPISENFKQHEG